MKRIQVAGVYITFSLLIMLLDRVTKAWAVASQVHDWAIFPGLSCDLAFNRGISWSMLSFESNFLFALVTLMNVAITLWIAHMAWQRWQQRACIAGELMVMSGAISNIIDRVLYGGVVDFIDVHFQRWHWPTFNIADISIVLGVSLMLWFHVREQ